LRRFFVITIPIITLIIFILIMLSDVVLKKPLTGNDDIPGTIEQVIQEVRNGKWDMAESKVNDLDKAWKKVARRVQFSAEKDEINEFDMNMARLKGSIMAKDKTDALIELNEAFEHWDNLGK